MFNKINGPILITGASGFIAANLVRRLVDEKRNDIHLILRGQSNLWRLAGISDKVTIHNVDLTDRKNVFATIEAIKPKTIFHLAVYGAYSFQKEVTKIEETNLHGTINLLDACMAVGFDTFINTGSSSEYGFKQTAMKETDMLEPNSYYAVFKASVTHYCQYTAKANNLSINTLRPFSVYGPYEEPARLVPKLITALLENNCPPLVSPDTARDYIYIDDIVDAYLELAKRPDLIGEIFNIGSGVQTTMKEIVDKSIELIGAKVEPQWGTMEQRIWDQNIWQSDISKAKTILGWQPKNDLSQGLIKSIEWFKNNIELYKND